MQTYEILVQNRAVKGNSKDMTLVRTSVGIDQVHILFDSDEWLGFPVTITFAQGEDIVTQSLLVSTLEDSEWVAEATVTVPYEVIDMTGPIRVTIQGTDSQGRHIITAKGSPLSVEESGDVVVGTPPADAPSVDQWQQAYAQAMNAANAAQSAAGIIDNRLETIVDEVTQRILDAMSLPVATRETLGGVIVGDNIAVDENGVISITQSASGGGMTVEQARALVNLSRLAYQCFDAQFDDDGLLMSNTMVKKDALPTIPVAGVSVVGLVKVDDDTIKVLPDGTISAPYELPLATNESVGGIMLGDNIEITDEGAAYVNVASAGKFGVVKVDGTTITASNGVITATGGGGGGGYVLPVADDSQLGGVKVGYGLSVDQDGTLSVTVPYGDEMMF